MLLPIPLLFSSALGLLSLVFLVISLMLLYRAYQRFRELQGLLETRRLLVAQTREGAVVTTQERNNPDDRRRQSRRALRDRSVWLPFATGLALFLFTFAGRELVRLGFRNGTDDPKPLHSNVVHELDGPAGTRIHVEVFGRADAPTLLFTHGWSTSSTEWYYAKQQLADRYQLVLWDIPGLGQSRGPNNEDYSLDAMARELNVVVSSLQGKPVILVGHSIGGMINLTFCRLFPQQLGHAVAGIVEVDTSYTNPVTTTQDASQNEALQKPVGEPVLHLVSLASPVARALNWLSYQNGTSQMVNAKSGFGGSETWGQVDLISRYGFESSPDVVARGTLAMFHWDAKPVLARIPVPVLILVGQQDTTTLPSASVFMQQNIPQASMQTFSPAAHYGLLELNADYDAAIAHFAAHTFPPGRS